MYIEEKGGKSNGKNELEFLKAFISITVEKLLGECKTFLRV
jgi:hypothetical protein